MLEKLFSSQLFKNFSYLALGELLNKLLALIVILFIARVMGPFAYGKLSFAVAVLSYFTIITNLGMDTYGIREVACDRSKANYMLSNILAIKLVLFLLSFVLLIFTVQFLKKDPVTIKIIILLSASMFFNAIFSYWYFQVIDDFKSITVVKVLQNVIYVALVFLYVKGSDNLISVVVFQLVGMAVMSVYVIIKIRKNISLKLIDLHEWGTFVKFGIVLAASTLMVQIYYNMDKVMIGLWYPDQYVGWYDAAYRIIQAGLILSTLQWSVFLPKIVSYDKSIFRAHAMIRFTMGIVQFAVIFIGAPIIIKLLFGDKYIDSTTALRILSVSMMLVYINVTYISPLSVWGYEKLYLFIVTSGAIVNFILNIVLIPKYNIVGAAYATCMSELTVLLVGMFFYKKYNLLKKLK